MLHPYSDSDSGSYSSTDSEGSDKIYQGLFIPIQGRPKEISLRLDDLSELLKAEMTDHISRNVGDYDLVVFGDDDSVSKKLDYNSVGSIVAGQMVLGPVVVIDNFRDLTMDDLDQILQLANTECQTCKTCQLRM